MACDGRARMPVIRWDRVTVVVKDITVVVGQAQAAMEALGQPMSASQAFRSRIASNSVLAFSLV